MLGSLHTLLSTRTLCYAPSQVIALTGNLDDGFKRQSPNLSHCLLFPLFPRPRAPAARAGSNTSDSESPKSSNWTQC